MKVKACLLLFAVALLNSLVSPPARAAEYQWSVPVTSMVSDETKDYPRAFLYIPPGVSRVRAVIVGQHNLLEEPVMEHPALRRALAELGMAEVWVSPAIDGDFRFDRGAGEKFNGMMKALAQESGYGELEFAPIVPIGHSAMANYPYYFAAWNPGRTLAAISLKGYWLPDHQDSSTPPFKGSDMNNVPLLYIGGELEGADWRAPIAANFRQRNPLSPFTMLADPGSGHFDHHDALVNYIALYLRKVAEYRLPRLAPLDGPVPLRPIDPTTSGWLYDRWRKNAAPQAPPAPVGQYTGSENEAFWAFDEELARATDAYEARYRNLKPQLLGIMQDGAVIPQNPKAHFQVPIALKPLEDGVTFKLQGTFIDTVPEGRPVGWTGQPAGSTIDHAKGGGPVNLDVITGPLEKLDDTTFRIRYGRAGFNPRRGGDVWFMATHPGDALYSRAVQQAYLRIPTLNTAGADQTLTFPELADQKAGVISVKLNATASSGLPVQYFVREGPAEVSGDNLKFTAMPPRSKFPIRVTVTAYQWGRTTEPRLKTAGPITREMWIQPADGRVLAKRQEPPSALEVAARVVTRDGLLVLDNFDSNSGMEGRSPEPTNVGGGAWHQSGKAGLNSTWAEKARLGSGMGDGIVVGKYPAGAKLSLSAQINLKRVSGDQATGLATHGAGLGYFSTLVTQGDSHGYDSFTGLVLDRTGSLRLIVDGGGLGNPLIAANFNPEVDHLLSYTVETATGTLSEIRLDGVTLTPSVPAGTFTAARLTLGGFYCSGAKHDDEIAFDNFNITVARPIPETFPGPGSM